MADNPFLQYGAVNDTGMMNEIRAMRAMSLSERLGNTERPPRMPSEPAMHYPRTSFAGGRGGLGGNPMLSQMLSGAANEPDYSQFTYDPQAHAAASQYLGQYGLSPVSPQDVKHNAVLPNTGFFGNHPKVSGMLEGALFGAAATRGSDTIGEGISNVAGGLLEGRMARQGMLNRQFETPFHAAAMLERLEDMKATRALREEDIQHLRAQNQKLARPDHDFRAFGVGRDTPTIATFDSTDGSIKTVPNPDYDPREAAKSRGSQSEWAAYQVGHPDEPVDDQIKNFAKLHKAPKEPPESLVGVTNPDGSVDYKVVSGGTHIGPGSPIPQTPGQLGAQKSKDQTRADKLAKARQDYINKQSKDNEFLLRNFGKTTLDKGVEKQVGAYYDENIAPHLNAPE